jgi:zinc/manganese transport system substrate-binding protein
MRVMSIAAIAAACLGGWAGCAVAQPRVVAAENFYGDVARQIVGTSAQVSSILSNPDDDPHLFEASPSVARALAGADIVVVNGADYDPWMDKLLAAHTAAHRVVIKVADLIGRRPGDNPHLWYDPATMPAFARALTGAMDRADPAGAATYDRRLALFLGSLRPLDQKVAAMKGRFAGLPVTATEPVFGYMAAALGLVMRDEAFQIAVMNDTEPSPSQVAGFEADLRQHRARVLFYNTQATDDAARRALAIARDAGVPVVGVSETEPAGKNYQQWMTHQLDELDQALSKPAS